MKTEKPLTRRQQRQATSKFKNADSNYKTPKPGIQFLVAALYFGHDKAQDVPCKSLGEALDRFAAISKNPNVLVVKVIKLERIEVSNESKISVLHQLHKTNQQFVNSKVEHIWRKPGSQVLLTNEGLKKQNISPFGLELARTIYSDGSPWWESHR